MKKKACAAKFVAKWKSFWTMRRIAAKTKHAACMANRKCKAKYMAKRQAMKVALQKKRHAAMERYAKCMKEKICRIQYAAKRLACLQTDGCRANYVKAWKKRRAKKLKKLVRERAAKS